MTDAINPRVALETIWKIAPLYAKAKAERVYVENFLRSKKSILMKQSGEQSINAQERDAYANHEYLDLLEGLKEAVFSEETLRWKLIASEAAIEVWRSQESSNRMLDKATK